MSRKSPDNKEEGWKEYSSSVICLTPFFSTTAVPHPRTTSRQRSFSLNLPCLRERFRLTAHLSAANKCCMFSWRAQGVRKGRCMSGSGKGKGVKGNPEGGGS